jgi:hypothetical protein
MSSTESNIESSINTFADLEKLRITQDFDDISVETVYTYIPLRKPSKTEFFRVNPSEDSRGTFLFLKHKDSTTKSEDLYLIVPELVSQIADIPDVSSYLVVTAVSRPDNTPFLWPVRLPKKTSFGPDTWAISAQVILKKAEETWLRKEFKTGVQGHMATLSKADWPEPEFPDLSFKEMLTKAIPEQMIIKDQRHTVIRKIRGEI